MITTLDRLVDELRRVGLPISVSEKVDAAATLDVVDLADRAAVKDGLSAVLVKDAEHESAYDTVFDLFFSLSPRAGNYAGETGDGSDCEAGASFSAGASATGDGGGEAGLRDIDDDTLRALVIDTLDRDSGESLLRRNLAALLVDRHAGIQPGRQVAGTYYLFRTMRALGAEAVTTALVERAEQQAPPGDEIARRLQREHAAAAVLGFQLEIEAEIRRRLVADRGADAVARTLRRPLPEDVDFLTAASAQLDDLRHTLGPLSLKLAARVSARRRQSLRGPLDFRRTVRWSLATGGIPAQLVFRKPRPTKPQLVVLADISGSVSAFAAFTLQLTYALRDAFTAVRCYVFIDGVDDVTDLLARADTVVDVASEINRAGLGVWLDGRSDYGNAIETFWDRHASDLRSRTTLLVLGDARTNYHAARAETLAKIADRCAHVFWLNPEPEAAWDSGDSVISQYAKHCDDVVECRNLRQLRAFVDRLA